MSATTTARMDRKVRREAKALLRETRRALRAHVDRIPHNIRSALGASADALEKAFTADDLGQMRAELPGLDELADEHLAFARKSTLREYVESIGVAVLIALALRACVIEAFKIPSGSMIPTMEIGDHIFVNKFLYGLHIPMTDTKLFQFRGPRRGEVIVFINPCETSKDFIKRVVALADDTVEIRCNILYVNGHEVEQKPSADECEYWDHNESPCRPGAMDEGCHLWGRACHPNSPGDEWATCGCRTVGESVPGQDYETDYDPRSGPNGVRPTEHDFPELTGPPGEPREVPCCRHTPKEIERNPGIDPWTCRIPEQRADAISRIHDATPRSSEMCAPQKYYVVPKGHVFVMGDNREHSSDSRVWGTVPIENIKGKAVFIWWSRRPGEAGGWTLDRMGKLVH